MASTKKLNQEDIKQYVTEDLLAKIQETKAELSKLKFNHSVSTLENPSHITATRKNLARLLTEKSKREKAAKN